MQVQNGVLSVTAFPSETTGGTTKSKKERVYSPRIIHAERGRNTPLKTDIPLPPEVDEDNIKAEFNAGVLKLFCPMLRAKQHEKKTILFSSEEYPFSK